MQKINFDAVVAAQAEQYTRIIEGKQSIQSNCVNTDARVDNLTSVSIRVDKHLYNAMVALLEHHNIDESVVFSDMVAEVISKLQSEAYVFHLVNKTPASIDAVGIKAIRK